MFKKIFYEELTFKNFIKAPNPDSESETLVEAELSFSLLICAYGTYSTIYAAICSLHCREII